MIYTATAKTTALEAAGQENNPVVAWSNLGAYATLGGTAVLTGGDRANAVTGTTYDKWRPDVTSTTAELTFTFASATEINFGAIAVHNLSDFGGSMKLMHSTDGISWTDAGAGQVTPSDNGLIAFRLASGISKQYWKFYFSGLTASDLLSVGVAFIGIETIIPTKIYQGFSPVITATEVSLQSNVSAGGHLLGSIVVSSGSTFSSDFSNLSPTFIRGADWLDFQTQFNAGSGFFLAWRPAKYAQDVHYCAREGSVLRPTNSGPNDLMSISMPVRVYDNG